MILFQGDWRNATKADENGLVSGHAYTITNVMRVSCEIWFYEFNVQRHNSFHFLIFNLRILHYITCGIIRTLFRFNIRWVKKGYYELGILGVTKQSGKDHGVMSKFFILILYLEQGSYDYNVTNRKIQKNPHKE